jgi:hypothetical protein
MISSLSPLAGGTSINLRRIHVITERILNASPFSAPVVAIMDTKDSVPIPPSCVKNLLKNWKLTVPVFGPYEIPPGNDADERWWICVEAVFFVEPSGLNCPDLLNVWTTAGMITLPNHEPWKTQ